MMLEIDMENKKCNEKLSVIVAVYNVQPYIETCIQSLCNQTYRDLEIILVDDGSSDNSGSICDDYAEKDSRIYVIHQENKGVGAARNTALKACTGAYITIVDSDDYVLPETFAVCIENMKKYNLERFGFSAFSSGNGYGGTGELVFSFEEDKEKRIRDCIINEGALAWGSVMRRELWEGVFYPEGRVFEDSVIAYQITERINRCGGIDKAYYYYRKTPGSICDSSIYKPKSRFDYILACEDRLKFAEERNICVEAARSALLKSVMSYFTSFYAMNDNDVEKYEYAKMVLAANRFLPYDKSLLNSKYRIYISLCGKMDFVHKVGAKLSLLGNLCRSYFRKVFSK